MREAIGVDIYNLTLSGGVAMALRAARNDNEHLPCVIVREVYTPDEKMGKAYIHREQANTLAQRDYKQPQAVIYEIDRHNQ